MMKRVSREDLYKAWWQYEKLRMLANRTRTDTKQVASRIRRLKERHELMAKQYKQQEYEVSGRSY
jgi:hypothetical protein